MAEFKPGDLVEIHSKDSHKWNGFRARVAVPPKGKEPLGGSPGSVWLEPLSNRPDGFGRAGFFWFTTEVKKVKVSPQAVLEASLADDRETLTQAVSQFDSAELVELLAVLIRVGEAIKTELDSRGGEDHAEDVG